MIGNPNMGRDILCTAAVIVIVLWHRANLLGDIDGVLTPDWAKLFGAISVELFYSLSGYLIGHILLNLVDAPSPAGWLRYMTHR